MRFPPCCCPGLRSHLQARLKRRWGDLLPSSLMGSLAAFPQGCFATWRLASSRTSDPREGEGAHLGWEPRSFQSPTLEGTAHPSAAFYGLESNQLSPDHTPGEGLTDGAHARVQGSQAPSPRLPSMAPGVRDIALEC